MPRLTPKIPALCLLIIFLVFHSGQVLATETGFYALNKRWENRNSEGISKKDALDQGFSSALFRGVSNVTQTPSVVIKRTLAEIIGQSQTVRIDQHQTLLVKANGDIVKFVSTDDGIATLETASSDTLRIVGTGVGSTFVHIWDVHGRNTFQLQVAVPPLIFSSAQVEKIQALEKSRSFKLGYNNSRGAFYVGDKLRENRRSSVDFTQDFKLTGDSPYGAISSTVQTQKARSKTQLTQAQLSLKDGRIGPYKNFDAALGDSQANQNLIVFPSARIRGAVVDHWDDDRRVRIAERCVKIFIRPYSTVFQ